MTFISNITSFTPYDAMFDYLKARSYEVYN